MLALARIAAIDCTRISKSVQGEFMQAKTEPRYAGLILAGGRSRRFGAEKALAVLRGRTLLEWALRNLSPFVECVAVSAAPSGAIHDAARDKGLPVVSDTVADAGPLAGVHAGLIWAQGIGANWLLTLPCDVPVIAPDTWQKLKAATTGHRPSYARTQSGPESLCAAWPVDCLPALLSSLQSGKGPSAIGVLESLQAVPVYFETAFHNINTREDLEALERAIQA